MKTIKVKLSNGTIGEITGKVVILPVGNKKIKFLIDNEKCELTHYVSGLRVGRLNEIKIRYSRSYVRITDRTAAIELISDITSRLGVDETLKRFDSAEKIN